MMDRRTFTFATLVGLGTATAARAAPPQAERVASPGLRGTWVVKRKGSKVEASLTLHNDGAEAIDVMVSRGREPGPSVVARVEGEPLPRVLTELERRDMITRIGPLPQFEPLMAGKSKQIGTYTFQLSDPDTREITFELGVSVVGEHVNLPTQTVSLATRAS